MASTTSSAPLRNFRRGRHVRLTIAGDGPYLAHLQSLAAELGVADVDFVGWLGPDGVRSFLGSIDVMVAPDKDTTYGHYCAMNKVTHAMANAIPVALRPLSENLRLTGHNAFVASDFSVVALADALDRFLDSSEAKRASVGAALQARYRANHDWSQQRTAYLGALRRAARCS